LTEQNLRKTQETPKLLDTKQEHLTCWILDGSRRI